MVLEKLTYVVDDTIRELGGLWKENQATVLSRLRIATANIKTHSELAKLIENTIGELEKVKRLDAEKLIMTVSGTPGELVVAASRKKLWHRTRTKPATPAQAPAENKPNGLLSLLLKQALGRWGRPKAIESQSTPTTPSPESPSSLPVACTEASVANGGTTSASPNTKFACLEVAVLPANMADALRACVSELQGSGPTLQEIVKAVGGNPSDNERVEDQVLSQEVLRKYVLATSLDPLISNVKTSAQSSMTESLKQMEKLAPRAVLDALEEYYGDIERQLKVQESEDYTQFRKETLQRLTCWVNLVAALGAIKEMKRLLNEPVVQVASSRPSTLLVESPGSPSSSLRSPSPSTTRGLFRV